MNPFMAYDAVSTKISARKSNMLNEAKFKGMLQAGTVDQIAQLLMTDYHFKHILEEAGKHPLHRDDLETLFKRFMVSEIEDLLHYVSGPYKEFLQTFLLEFEMYDLVLILRQISQGGWDENTANHFVHSLKYSLLPYDQLMASKSVAQLVEKLKGTIYYDVLKTTTGDDFAKRDFHVETKLQLLFYNALIKQAQKLSSADKLVAEKLLGAKIDGLNVQWIYRAKKYYQISPERIFAYSLQGGQKLGSHRLKVMSYAKSMSEVQELTNKYLRYDIFESEDALAIERKMNHYIYEHIADDKLRGNIGTIVSYVYLLEIVIKEFIIATETVRYKIPKEQVGDYLVRSMAKEEVKQ